MEIIELKKEHFDRTVRIKAEAFSELERFGFFFPDPDIRPKKMAVLLRMHLAARLGYCRVWTTAPEVAGSAWWFPPGVSPHLSDLKMIRAGFLAGPLRFGIRPFSKMVACDRVVNRIYDRFTQRPTWVLDALSVDKPLRGGGLGRRLLEPALAEADRGGFPALVVTHDLGAARFYTKLGFAEVFRGPTITGGPEAIALLREPATAG